MKQVTLNIPESKYKFFMELVRNLGLETNDIDIPEEHKKIVRERIKLSDANPDRLLNWDHVQDNFNFD